MAAISDARQDGPLIKSERSQTLWKTLVGDFASAGISALLIAAPLTIIDRAVVEGLSKRQSLLRGLQLHSVALRRPLRLLSSRPCRIMWTLYAATYAVANSSDTLSTYLHLSAAGAITFLSTTIVNVPLGVWKDVRFAQLYGVNPVIGTSTMTVKPGVSRAAIATFLLRDSLTIFGSFTLAPSMAASIPDSLVVDSHSKYMVSQLTVPVLSQLIATPVHLLGLDYQSRQYQVLLSERLKHIKRDLPSATLVRCARIIPAFGIGCLVNSEIRAFCHNQNS